MRPDNQMNENPCLQRNPTGSTARVSFSTRASYKSPRGSKYIPNLVPVSVAPLAVWILTPFASKEDAEHFSAARWGTKSRPQPVSIRYDEATLRASTRSLSAGAASGECTGVLLGWMVAWTSLVATANSAVRPGPVRVGQMEHPPFPSPRLSFWPAMQMQFRMSAKLSP